MPRHSIIKDGYGVGEVSYFVAPQLLVPSLVFGVYGGREDFYGAKGSLQVRISSHDHPKYCQKNADNNSIEDLEELLEVNPDEMESGEEIEAPSRALGEGESVSNPDLRQKAPEKTETPGNREENKKAPQIVKKTFASLFVGFVGNSQRSEGPVKLLVEDVEVVARSSLAKFCSKVGNPICVNKFMASSERVSYARALVEIDVAKEVVKCIEVELPSGLSGQVMSGQESQVTELPLQHKQPEIPAKNQDAQQEWRTKQGRKNKSRPEENPVEPESIPDQTIKQIAREVLRTKVQQVQVQVQEETPEAQVQVTESSSDHNQSCSIASGEMENNIQQTQKVQIIGRFNVVLNGEKKTNGLPVTHYEVKDFQDCCHELGIENLRFNGLFYTWSNNSVWSKLDRAMVNTKWLQEGPPAMANFGLPEKYSDHFPCVVSLFDNKNHGARPFKFFNMWTQHSDFIDIVSNAGRIHVEGTAMFRLCKKLKALKDPLRKLNRLHFSHISARAEVADEELLQVQQLLHDNPSDESLKSSVADLRKKATRLAEAELSFCSQLAKAKDLKNCDKGTKFFHDLIMRNKSRNQIVSLLDANGVATTSPQQVSSLFVDYYKNLLGTRKECPRLDSEILSEGTLVSDDQAIDLVRPMLDEEIKAALFDIGDDKAPGPDGYSSCFFKKSWSATGADYGGKWILLNQTKLLEKLIDPAQSAFVPNRSMVENIYMVQELLRKYSWKRISPRCILLHGFFKGKQGLRQGDPLSPFLCEFCLEVLSRNMGRLGRNPHFNHHPKCSEMSIIHLAFADDLILFTRGEVTSVSLSMECLKKFRDCSGLCINASKSNVYMAGICPDEMEEIKLITGFSIGEFPFRYLGIPVASSRLTTE
ncbi:hypothetical protein Acr_05g0000840 [Actinidia rufa]|uniref:Reverse transcriptase domain-containing protein n=1 Tax=Actinidia rufa TaxID=165716 RepID=A0A7J0EIZ9_9ERIC|nr:hypothetical protein Acr_05g0000840 [Actinidia rufa]